jgi:pimeloyl-ACP methyl ester carboxylesterase
VVAPDLPLDDPQTSYAERAEPAVRSLDGAGEPAVVIGHSLGVAYVPLVLAAIPGASVVYLCPAPTGPFDSDAAPMPQYRDGFPFPPNRADGTSVWEPEAAIAAMYSHLPLAVARDLAGNLKPGASARGAYPLASLPACPARVFYAAHDEIFMTDWSRWAAREIAGTEPLELDTGHFPMIEAPDALAEALLR